MAQKFLTNFTPPGTSDLYKFRAGALFYGTTSNSTTAMTVSIPGVTEYYTGLTLILKMGAQAASGCTLNVNSLGAKAMKYGANSVGTYFTSGATYLFVYDGTDFKAVHSYNSNTTYTSLKNPYALTIQGNGTTLTNGTYDGSAAKTVNITPASIGAAASSHTHNYAGSSSAGGAASTVAVTETTPSSATTYYLHYSTGVSGSQTTRANTDLYYYDTGSSSYFNVGSSSNIGGLTLHYNNGKYVNLITDAVTANRDIKLPDASGTIALKGHTHTVTYAKSATATGSTTQGGSNAETSITPAGTVSQPTFTGTAHNHTFTGTAHGHTFTGSAHTHTLTPTTTDIYSITSVGSMFTATVSGEVLVLTAGSAPTRSSSAIKAYTGLTIANATQGGTISNTTATGSIGNTTATGTVSKPTFTGTAAKHTHTFTGSAHTHAITLTDTTVTSST